MDQHPQHQAADRSAGVAFARPRRGSAFVRLARPRQWAKSVFVVIGPAYAWANEIPVPWVSVAGAVVAFSLASSACYVVNDIVDREADRTHPRKRHRPIASGAVTPAGAWVFAVVLIAAAAGSLALVPLGGAAGWSLPWVAGAAGLYVLNTLAYSFGLKRVVMLDVVSLAVGFVLRVLGGCAAAGIEPTSWLLNCSFFIAMFLSFGKRLGERRTAGADAPAVRGVQSAYTDDMLRMAVVVTAVAALVTYAGYVEAQEGRFRDGFNLLWLTILPATYGLLRCIVLLERGAYDDPTELAAHDRPFQAAAVLFAGITLALVVFLRPPGG